MAQSRDPNTLTLLARAHVLLSRQVAEGVARAGHPLKPSHNAVFGQLGADGKRLTDLAKTAAMTPQAMAELVDELEVLGYVERTPDSTDRRAKLIRLTERGRATTKLGSDTIRRIEGQISAILGDEGHEHLRDLLTHLLADSHEA